MTHSCCLLVPVMLKDLKCKYEEFHIWVTIQIPKFSAYGVPGLLYGPALWFDDASSRLQYSRQWKRNTHIPGTEHYIPVSSLRLEIQMALAFRSCFTGKRGK